MDRRESEPPSPEGEIEITAAMIDAGEEAAIRRLGGAELGGLFLIEDLVCAVYLAMDRTRRDGVRSLPVR